VQDVHGLEQYAWMEVVWWVLVEVFEEMENQLSKWEVYNVQRNGFTLLIQVCLR